MIWYSHDPGTKSLVLSAHGKLSEQRLFFKMTSGPRSNASTYCFVVCPPYSGPRLPARRPGPPMVRPYGLPDSAQADHRARPCSTNDLVFSPLEGLGEN